MRRIQLAIIVTLICCGMIAPVRSAFAQSPGDDPAAGVGTTPLAVAGHPVRQVDVGDSVELRFALPVVDPDTVVVTMPALSDSLAIIDGPVLVSRGQQSLELRLTLQTRRPGREIVPEIEIASESDPTPRVTERILIETRDPSSEAIPFGAAWRVLAEEVIEGQSVPVVLEIQRIESFTFPESIAYRAPESGLFEEVGGLGEVASERIGNVTLYSIPVAGFIFTPTSVGTVTLPTAQVSAQGIQATAAPRAIVVEPPPPLGSGNGAIGDYEVSIELSNDRLGIGDTATIQLLVTGRGNLPVIQLPEITLTGLTELGRSEESDIRADTEEMTGYVGQRSLVVRFEPQGEIADARIEIGAFSWYDPIRGESGRTPPRTLRVVVQTPDAVAQQPQEIPSLELLSLAELQRAAWIPLRTIPWVYFVFLAGPLAFGVARLLSVRAAVTLAAIPFFLSFSLLPSLDTVRLERAAELAEENRPAVAAVLVDLELQRADWHAGLHYNRGVLSLRAQDAVSTVYHLRRAVRLAPLQADFRTALEIASAYLEATDQPRIPRIPHPDLFAIVTLVLWSMFWVFFTARGRVRRTLALVTVAILVALAGGAWLWADIERGQREGVVTHETIVRRIPDLTASPWIQLSPATALEVELSYNDFYLVRTASGVTGWIPRRTLWLHGE